MPAPRVALVTHPEEGAADLARLLVERRLAACVNLVAVRSVYRWEGEVQDDAELLLVVKTTDDRLDALRAALDERHPYDVFELVALDPAAVAPRYLAWMEAETRPAG